MKNIAEHCKFHFLYRIVRDDSRFYVGMHSTDDIDDGYFGSGLIIKAWVKKYGRDLFWQKHSKEIIEFLPTRANLEIREAEVVSSELLKNSLCMNLSVGGKGGSKFTGKKHTSASKKKMADANIGIPKTLSHKAAISKGLLGSKNFLGKIHSDETCAKISASRMTACTVDGMTIFESRRALVKALGKGTGGTKSPSFRHVISVSKAED